MSVPTVKQSAVVNATIEEVWAAVSRLDFCWWGAVKRGLVPNPNTVGSDVTLEFKDGTVQKFRLVEFSSMNESFALELVESAPAHYVMGTLHKLSLLSVTTTNQTFVQWETDFSSDVSQEVVQDSKYKKIEALGDLAACFVKKQ